MTSAKRTVKVDSVNEDSGVAWVELVYEPKKRLQIAIPLRHVDYNTALREKVANLTPGEFYEMTLLSENERNTKWRPTAIKEGRGPVADDRQ